MFSLYPDEAIESGHQCPVRHLYTLLFYLLVPFAITRLLWRSRREPLYRAFIAERFGFSPTLPRVNNRIWVHAVSAGETNAAAPLIRKLLDDDYAVVVTNMTPTGRQRVAAHFGDRVDVAYAPYDLPSAQRRFLARTRPQALVIIDTELWPNMLITAKQNGLATLLVNARMSEKSARGYAAIRYLTQTMLKSLDMVATQTKAHSDRFQGLGFEEEKLRVTGSIKFDIELPSDLEERSKSLQEKTGGRAILLGASTHPGEEEALMDAFDRVKRVEDESDVLLVLAPRHSHRTEEVLVLCQKRGHKVARLSTGEAVTASTDILLVDTMGELIYFYKVATLAFVGGSLVDVGGHNPMEPAALHTPILMGPYLRNIDDIVSEFVDGGGLRIVKTGAELASVTVDLMNDPQARVALVAGADHVMEANRGALTRTLELIEHTVEEV